MLKLRQSICLLACVSAGCSSIQFSNRDTGDVHPYRVAMPALKVVTAPDCQMTAEVISIPGALNYLKFKSGLGKIDATVEFEPGGTIKKIMVKQEGATDDLIKLLQAAGGLGSAGLTSSRGGGCSASVQIYPIQLRGGVPFVDRDQAVLDVTARTSAEAAGPGR